MNDRNTWTHYYKSTLSKPQRERRLRVVQSEKQAPQVLRGAEKQIAEDNAQFRRYRRAKAAEYRTALQGPHGYLIKHLHDTLRTTTLHEDHGVELVTLVEATHWPAIDPGIRYIALSLIDDAIIRLREANGMAPFDDAIFDEDPTVFEICKARIGVP